MKTLTAAAMLSLFISTSALAQTAPAPSTNSDSAPAATPTPVAPATETQETLVGRPSAIRTQLSGWFIAPTFTTTSFANSLAYGVNQFRPKDPNYDLIFSPNMIPFEKIIEANNKLITKFNGSKL